MKRIIVILALALIVFISHKTFQDYKLSGGVDDLNNPEHTGTTTPDISRSISLPETLNRKIVINIPAREKDKVEIAETIAILRVNPESFDDWFHLGNLRRGVGDFVGAIEAWTEASRINPVNSVTLHNIAVAYAYDLKNYPEADKYFQKAIEVSPKSVFIYFQASEFYQYVTKDINKAIKTVELGVKYNPTDSSLKNLLVSLKEFSTEN